MRWLGTQCVIANLHLFGSWDSEPGNVLRYTFIDIHSCEHLHIWFLSFSSKIMRNIWKVCFLVIPDGRRSLATNLAAASYLPPSYMASSQVISPSYMASNQVIRMIKLTYASPDTDIRCLSESKFSGVVIWHLWG